MVKLSLEGETIGGGREPSSERRLHLAIYAARPDVAAIVHTHSVHATAWSFLGEPLDTGTEEFEQVAGGPVRTTAVRRTREDAIARAAVEALEGRRRRFWPATACWAWATPRHAPSTSAR